MNAWGRALPWLALAGLCWFAFFYHLGALPLYPWDESRLAETALEMTRNGNWLVTYYEGTPDLWSPKPPLMIWLMALSIEAFGPVEWAVRLPSAIAASITTVVLYLFLSVHFRDRLAGFVASAALMSTLGYVAKHAARSADYDALLTLWTTLYMLAFYLALENEKRRSLYLAAFAVASVLAVLTKSIQGVIFFAPLAAYVVAVRQHRLLLKAPSLYLAFLVPIALGCLFYVVREHADPGYIAAALHTDVGRFTAGIDGRPNNNPLYYVLQPRNLPWLPGLPFALWICWRHGRPREKALTGFLGTSVLGYFLIISFAQTKQGWYALPLHPLCALMIGVGSSVAIRQYGHRMHRWGGVSGVTTVACALMALAVIGLNWVLVRYYYPALVAEPPDQYSFFLRRLPQLMPDHRHVLVLHPGYKNSGGFDFYVAPTRFYVTALNDRGYDISLEPLSGTHQPREDEAVLACGDNRSAARKKGAVTIAEAYGCTAWTNPPGPER
jgi:4-amino-4-deoxy-L-arabinose transferase-like glycosyltransferase